MLCSVSSTWITAHNFGINSYTNPGVVTPGAESTSRHGPPGDRPTTPGTGTDVAGTTLDVDELELDGATLDVDELDSELEGATMGGAVGNVAAPPSPSPPSLEQPIIAMAANATNAPPRARNTATSTTPTGHSNSAESAKTYPTSPANGRRQGANDASRRTVLVVLGLVTSISISIWCRRTVHVVLGLVTSISIWCRGAAVMWCRRAGVVESAVFVSEESKSN